MSPQPPTFLPLGAIIQTLPIRPSHSSTPLNIVQGFPTSQLYTTHNSPFFGETIGRVANRIANAKIESLNGKSYELAKNNGKNTLHGGVVGWGKRVWEGSKPVGWRVVPGLEGGEVGGEAVEFTLRSEDGDEGYPGTVDVSVVYTTAIQTVDGKEVTVLGIEYEVKLVGDEVEETVVNVTNHSYFNLTGDPTIEGTQITLHTNSYLPIDDGGIPTSGPTPYTSITPGAPFVLGAQEPDIDDCFVIPPSTIPLDTRSSKLSKLVDAFHPKTGIHLEVLSTEPAFQFYTGRHIGVAAVEGVAARGARSGFCVEPGRYTNSINVGDWRGQVVLGKGQVYGSRVVYKGWSD